MIEDLEQIVAKLVALNLWKALEPFNWALRLRGTALPYFCTVMCGDDRPVRARLLLLEGWQTMHDYVRTRIDRNYGYYLSPMEMPHLELLVLANGEARAFRHDPGYMPVGLEGKWCELASRMLWEVYGVMLRVESDRELPMRFAENKSIFARVEGADGNWSDAPLEIVDAPVRQEKIVFGKQDLAQARDLPVIGDFQLAVDFRILPLLMTKEPRPRCVYGLRALDLKTGAAVLNSQVSVHPESGLVGMWQAMPGELLKGLVKLGKVPGEIRTVSGRVFRLLRPLGVELPFRLSLHDRIEALDRIF